MSKNLRAAIVGFVVAFVVGGAMGLLRAAAHLPVGITPMVVGTVFGAMTAFVMAMLASNRKVAQADPALREEALSLRPAPGRARLVVFRDGFIGRAAGLDVAVDGRPMTQLKSPRFSACTLAPGPHRITGGFGGFAASQNRGAEHDLVAEAGGVYVLRFQIAMGALKNSIRIEPVADLAAAQANLARMKMTAPDAAEF